MSLWMMSPSAKSQIEAALDFYKELRMTICARIEVRMEEAFISLIRRQKESVDAMHQIVDERGNHLHRRMI